MKWHTDSDIISGLSDVGSYSSPSVFQKDGTWYLISGNSDSSWFGWKWSGSEWQLDNGIIYGLSYAGHSPSPSVFQKDGTWYLISGEEYSCVYGWKWIGSEWQLDSDIISGLSDVGSCSSPSVFQKDGTWYLISGNSDGLWFGWKWSGSEWQIDNGIIYGLTDVGSYSSPSVFQKDGTWYLISGEEYSCVYGWKWIGSEWQIDNDIIYGLTDVGDYSSPSVFQKDGTWHLISGNCNGLWSGWNYLHLPTQYYVKHDGDNAKDGLSEANAWQTITYALTQMVAYDTLHIAAGAYSENVEITTDHITLIGAGSELVTIDQLELGEFASFAYCSGITATAAYSIVVYPITISDTTFDDMVGTQHVELSRAINMVATHCDFTECGIIRSSDNASFSDITFRTGSYTFYCLYFASDSGYNPTFKNITIMGVTQERYGIHIAADSISPTFTNITFEYPEKAIIVKSGSTATFIQENNRVFVGTTGTNTITPTESTLVATEGTYEYRDFTIIPDAEITLVETSLWEPSGYRHKRWRIAATGERTISFQLGDMLPNTRYKLMVDGIEYSRAVADSSGVVTFSYIGTFSEKEFHVLSIPPKRNPRKSA